MSRGSVLIRNGGLPFAVQCLDAFFGVKLSAEDATWYSQGRLSESYLSNDPLGTVSK